MTHNIEPLVCIAASLVEVANGRYAAHGTGQAVVRSVSQFAKCEPFLLPGIKDHYDSDRLAERIDGLVLPGGRANVEPHHFAGDPFPDDEPIDPGRDDTILQLVRSCIDKGVPIFGMCRGIQEMNVAMGGSLYYRVHLVEGKDDHRMPRNKDITIEEVFQLRHQVRLSGSLARIAGESDIRVNSLHGQGIDRLADVFAVEAESEDGLIEGIRLKDDATFTVGVQWHAEWEPNNHTLSRRLFEAFGGATRARARIRESSVNRIPA